MTTAFCWCPAYVLPSTAHRDRTRARLAELSGATTWNIVPAASCSRIGAPSTWPHPDVRVQELRDIWHADVLIAARGGYGCVHLLDALAELATPAPYLIGYSDLTVLHAWWWVRGWGETCYGYMPATGCGSRALATTVALAAGQGLGWDQASAPSVRTIRPGNAMGTCFAGCVRVLTSLCGTEAQPDLSDCILALEDVDERVYQLDRDLEQMLRSGLLHGITGLVLGSFRAKEPDGYAGPDLPALATAWAERLRIPTILGLPFGHEDDPLSLACGRPSSLEVNPDGTWSFHQAKAERSPVRS